MMEMDPLGIIKQPHLIHFSPHIVLSCHAPHLIVTLRGILIPPFRPHNIYNS